MNYITRYCLGMLFVANCFAQSTPGLPANLVKFTQEQNPKCVEYITYQNELYCSLAPLDKTPVDPQINTYEKQNIQFDNRPWRAAWGKKSEQITTVEYVPLGDDINDWKELVTTQFIPGLTDLTLTQYGERFLGELKNSGVKFTVTVIENQPEQLIFEFKVSEPANLQQDEIQKVVKGKEGVYIIHYAIKQPEMTVENRKLWTNNLIKSSLKVQ